MGLDAARVVTGSHLEHKLARIEEVLSLHPSLPFVLVGDSGQKDPEVYRRAVRDFPGRVRTVYIRDVTVDARDRTVLDIAGELAGEGVEMVLVSDSVAAAEHAAGAGLVAPDAVDRVREASRRPSG